MVIRVSDNNSRFDVARADDGNAEADPSPMVAHLAISIHIIYTLAQTKIRHSR